jgi:hypothetical protein
MPKFEFNRGKTGEHVANCRLQIHKFRSLITWVHHVTRMGTKVDILLQAEPPGFDQSYFIAEESSPRMLSECILLELLIALVVVPVQSLQVKGFRNRPDYRAIRTVWVFIACRHFEIHVK